MTNEFVSPVSQSTHNILNPKWSDTYKELTNRNIGYITFQEQERLRTVKIAVLGVGGLGGPLAEQLVRMGCENIVICDHDSFNLSNLNRQLCYSSDVGKLKVDVVKERLINVNSSLKMEKFYEVSENNIDLILNNVEAVALTLDDPLASIIIARACRKLSIPLLESWAIPFLMSWWFTKESISYEQCYGLSTEDMTIKEIQKDPNSRSSALEALLPKIFAFPNISERFDREPGTFKAMMEGKIPLRCMAPMVRLTASFLAFEMVFSGIINVKAKVLAPEVKAFDYFAMELLNLSLI